MSAQIITLKDRRPASVQEGGFEFTCGICGAGVVAFVRIDHFPTCLTCRMWCEATRDGVTVAEVRTWQ